MGKKKVKIIIIPDLGDERRLRLQGKKTVLSFTSHTSVHNLSFDRLPSDEKAYQQFSAVSSCVSVYIKAGNE